MTEPIVFHSDYGSAVCVISVRAGRTARCLMHLRNQQHTHPNRFIPLGHVPVWSKISNALKRLGFRSRNFQCLALTTGLPPRCDLSKLVNLRTARKPISDARTATYLIFIHWFGTWRTVVQIHSPRPNF